MRALHNPWPEVIHRLRVKKGLTQENAAEPAGVAPNTWHRWERPGFVPNEKQLEKILLGLDCSPDELGSAFAMAMSVHYLKLPGSGQGGPAALPAEPAPAVSTPPRPSGADGSPPDIFDALLDSVESAPEPEDLETLIQGLIGKSFSVVAALTAMITELIISWPRFRAEASEEDQHHVMVVHTHLHELMDVCLLVSEELNEIATSRRIPG